MNYFITKLYWIIHGFFPLSQCKKDIRSILLIGLFITLIFISNLPTSNHFNYLSDNRENSLPHKIDDENLPLTSSLNLTDFITGDGVNQTVRAYVNNNSRSSNNQNGMFEINAPASNTNLSYGDFKFNFDNNFTTSYVIEDDNALYPSSRYFEKYRFNSIYSYLFVNEGTEDPANDFTDVVDDGVSEYNTYWNISSSVNGIVNVTIVANFSGVAGIDFAFDRENIIALILNFTYRIDKNAEVTVYMKDSYQGVFTNITNTFKINGSLGAQDIDKLIINKNLNFINASDCTLIQFVFENTTTDFTVSFIEFDLNSFMVLELPITDSKNLALEFDLRGANSTINGCYIWIRTLNLTKAATAVLNITLYRANATMNRANLDNNNLINPDISDGKLYSTEIIGYIEDELYYFEFDTSQTNNLERFNYFIVITSDQSDDVYSLVTLPRGQFGDGSEASDHQLKNGTVGTDNWDLAFSDISIRSENAGFLDASQFKLNVTRGYMPSDFNNSLKIQDKFVQDYPLTYPNEPTLKWGLGYWTNNFTNPIGSNLFDDFQIYLTWNITSIKGFKFDVNYTVEAFRTENATTTYYASYNQDPQWLFNYSLNLDDLIYSTWNFTKIMFIYQDYFTAQNLTIPDFTRVLNQTGGETPFREGEDSVFTKNPIYKKVVVSTNIINTSEKSIYTGIYSLNLTSYNAILDNNMHSYINYDGILWETQGFMYGDNISLLLDIQDHNSLAPPSANGFANVSLFYPNGTLLSYISSPSGTPSLDGTRFTYDFDNNTILNLTKIIPLASEISNEDHYSLGYFWTNGSEIGCNRIPIYIDAYEINFNNISYIREIGKNLLSGNVNNHVILPYTLFAASINETTGISRPNFYSVSNLDVNQMFTYEQWGSPIPVTILMKSFLQNETVLNPEEDISFKVSIQNRFLTSLNIKISVKLVSLANEEWIIAEDESDPKNLELFGAQGDTKDFNVTLSIPEYNNDLTWKGQNAPIRQGGVKTIISLYIEDNFVGTFESNDYSLIVNSTEDQFEGQIIALKQLPFSDTFTGRYFERDECLYLPNQSTFIYNVFDENYVSIYTQAIKKFDLNLDSNFTNILFPSKIKQGEIFNITSTLETELGEILPNKLVNLQYESNGIWINTSTPHLTDANGDANFEVNTLNINILGTTPFKLSWAGDGDYLNKSNIFQVPIEVALNQLSLSSEDDKSFLYNNRKSTIELTIKNTGNSTLRINIDDIEVDIKEGFDYEIIGKDEIILKPGVSETIQIEIEVGNVGFEEEVEVHVEIKAVNILTNKIIFVGETIDLDIIDTPLIDYIIEYFLFIILAIFALMLFIAYYFSRHIKKKIELSAKEVSEKRPRRGKYVKVSELKAARTEILEEPTEEIEEIKPTKEIIEEEVLEKEKKTTDLDTLLEEEELKKEEISKKTLKHPEKKEKRPKEKVKKIKEKPAKTKKVKEKKQKAEKKLEAKKIETEKPLKVEPKQVEPKKVEPKKTTDLDTLLEDKGLKEDKEPKKVPKKVSEPAKKIEKSSPKPLSTRQMVEKKRGKKKSRKKKR